METLMGSCWEIFPLKFGEKDGLIWRPGDVFLCRKANGFSRIQKRDVLLGFSLSASFHCKSVRSVSSVAPEKTLVESEETDQLLVADQPKTVHVRFKLTRECAFGQHFLIVGDDPSLGLWDPSDGVRFDWSDGHVWTAELDVPCGKVIKYKFILKVNDNTISWQPGPDRILETWETEKTIIVFEDWNHPEFQDVAEIETPVSPVLLPGLIPMLTDETDEEPPNKVKDKELKDAHNSASSSSTATSNVAMENDKGFYGEEQLEILEGDMQWGRRMVQKFLDIFGF